MERVIDVLKELGLDGDSNCDEDKEVQFVRDWNSSLFYCWHQMSFYSPAR